MGHNHPANHSWVPDPQKLWDSHVCWSWLLSFEVICYEIIDSQYNRYRISTEYTIHFVVYPRFQLFSPRPFISLATLVPSESASEGAFGTAPKLLVGMPLPTSEWQSKFCLLCFWPSFLLVHLRRQKMIAQGKRSPPFTWEFRNAGFGWLSPSLCTYTHKRVLTYTKKYVKNCSLQLHRK